MSPKNKIIAIVMIIVVVVISSIFLVIAFTNARQSISNIDGNAVKTTIGIVLVLGLIVVYDFFFKKKRRGNGKGGIRRGWTEQEKEDVRHRQGGVCVMCGKSPPRWEYHHRNGNRSDNSLSNCQALCPTCHSVKTHG